MTVKGLTTAADITALLAMLRQIQCEPASFDTYSMASAAERAADAIERLSLSATASEKQTAEAVAAEREACAKLCETLGDDTQGHSVGWRSAAWTCRDMIRGRGATRA